MEIRPMSTSTKSLGLWVSVISGIAGGGPPYVPPQHLSNHSGKSVPMEMAYVATDGKKLVPLGEEFSQ